MNKRLGIVAVLLLLPGVAYGQSPGDVVSYRFQTLNSVNDGPNFIAPPGGFVLTDRVTETENITTNIYRDQELLMQYKTLFSAALTLAMSSGIPFEAATSSTSSRSGILSNT